jgi:uncharacterized repeat protein (TIGR03803 family)
MPNPARAQLLLCLILLLFAAISTSQAQTFSVIHAFSGGPDGGVPYAGLTMDRAGNLYGTTSAGGVCCGVVFKLVHRGSGWITVPLRTFHGNDGATPMARVVFGPDGALYGTTSAGGIGFGTVFKLTPSPTTCKNVLCPWIETVLYNFTGGADGANPMASVVFDQAGNLYGTTEYGGARFGSSGDGVVFKLTHSGASWTESVLYAFTGYPNDGSNPVAEVTFDNAGNIFGTTAFGGTYGVGTVFQLTPSGSNWSESVLYSTQPCYVTAGLVLDGSGNLYGATNNDGGNTDGAVFEVSPLGSGWSGRILYQFYGPNGFGAGPAATLLMDITGDLYGTTLLNGVNGCDGYGCGTVFKLHRNQDDTWSNTYLYQFSGGADGEFPYSNVVIDSNGTMFGTTSWAGSFQTGCDGHGCGVVWEITP